MLVNNIVYLFQWSYLLDGFYTTIGLCIYNLYTEQQSEKVRNFVK